MGITFSDHLIDSGYRDIAPEQEREIEARKECARRGLDPDDDAADGVQVWMVVDQEMRQRIIPAFTKHGSGAREFLAWVIEDRGFIEAEPDSPRDEQMQAFVRKGMLRFYRCIHGTNEYEITSEWMKGLA